MAYFEFCMLLNWYLDYLYMCKNYNHGKFLITFAHHDSLISFWNPNQKMTADKYQSTNSQVQSTRSSQNQNRIRSPLAIQIKNPLVSNFPIKMMELVKRSPTSKSFLIGSLTRSHFQIYEWTNGRNGRVRTPRYFIDISLISSCVIYGIVWQWEITVIMS